MEAWVDQACHLLNLLSKELQNDFDTFAESFIPVSFPSFHLDTKLLLLCHPMFWLVIMFLCWRHIGLVFIIAQYKRNCRWRWLSFLDCILLLPGLVAWQMLFKLVVITVLVIAESADTCIKTVGFSGLSQNFTAKIVHIFSSSLDNIKAIDTAFIVTTTNSLQLRLADTQKLQSHPCSSSNN